MAKTKELLENRERYTTLFTVDDFYNPESKELWMQSLTAEKKALSYIVFGLSEPIEIELSKDISNFTKDVIVAYYIRFMSTSIDYLNNVNSLLRRYTDWCIDESMVPDHQNHYDEINYDDLSRCINRVAVNEAIIKGSELLKWSRDPKLRNMCDLAAIALLFNGVKGNRFHDLLNVTYGDIDYENKLIHCEGRDVYLSDECLEICKKASQDEVYVLPNGREMPFKEKDFKSRTIFGVYRKDAGTGSVTNATAMLRNRFSKVLEEFGKSNITLQAIIDSGIIEYVTRLTKQRGLNVNEFIKTKECNDLVIKKFNTNQTWIGTRFYAKYHDHFLS